MTTPHAQEIYAKIRRLVLEEYEPGAHLQETSLARTVGTSRTPVRDALLRLHTEGFVERIAHRGYTVARITVKQLRDTFEVRRLIEGEIAFLAARFATAGDIERMRELAPYDFRIESVAGCRKATERNFQFHMCVAAASRNDYMVEILKDCLVKINRFLSLGVDRMESVRTAAHREHAALVDAIASRNAEDARRIVHMHLDRTMEAMMDELKRREIGIIAS